MKKNNIVTLIIAIIIPLVVGGMSSFLTKHAMMIFDSVKKPPLSPPGILFPIVWTILYVMMGVSSYLIYKEKDNVNVKGLVKSTLIIYGVQLFFNFFWSILFFKYSLYMVAFIWLVILWVLVFVFIKNALKINKIASYLMMPYLMWMTFAGYLNIMIAILNK